MAKEGIQLFIHKHNDIGNVYQILPGRRDPKTLSEVGGVGGGSFFISRTDPKIQDAEVLKSRNLCKVKVDGNVVDAFLINNREPTLVSQGENKDRGYLVSGGGLKSWFNDASVAPYGGIKKNSMDQRYFNFASESGSWYVPGDWVNPVIYGTVNVDTRWGVDRVKKWPEKAKDAKWIWAAPYQSPAPDTPCYFRWSVTTGAGLFAIYVTADDYFELYVDGEQIAKSNVSTSASYEAARVEIPLSAGAHTIAFMARNILAPGFNGPAALAAAFFSVADDKTETLISQSGSGTWKALAYPTQEPGWTAGEVMNKLLDEAQARGVLFPTYLTRTFSNTQDSKSVAWADKLAWTFKVGESYSSVLSKFEDLYDVWINPATMTLNMAPSQGTDRSTGPSPVQFVLGRDIVEAKTKAQGNIKNSLMVKSLEGWTTEEDSTSVSTYGRIEDSIDTGASQSMAKKLAALVFSSRAQEEIGATYQVISQKYKPNVDYFQGDWVLAPNERGVMVPRRIVSISYEESSAGRPLPTLEFDTIFQDNETRLANAVGKLGGGGVGGSLGNVSGSTPGVGQPIELPPTATAITLQPKAPTGLSASSVGGWTANGVNTTSTITLNWAAVTQYTDNSALVPAYYVVERKLTSNVQGWEIVGKYYTNSAVMPGYTPNQSWDFRVSTVDDQGVSSDTSASTTHNPVGPTTPMLAPTTPTLVSELGLIVVTWNGKLTPGPVDPPTQFRYVYAEMSTAASGQPWVRVGGSIQRGGGQLQIAGEIVGTTRHIRLIAVDGVGIASPASGSASVTIQGVAADDIDDAVLQAIEDAQADADAAMVAANGKNKNYYQAAKPTGGTYLVGDIWFDTDDLNKVYTYNGTDFVLTQDSAGANNSATAAQNTANSKNASFVQATAPTATKTGDLWIDTANGNVIKQWNGTAWVAAPDAAIAAAASAANAAQTTANGKNKTYYQAAQPSGGTYQLGDLWFDTDDNNKLYTYTGSAWAVTQDSNGALVAANGKNKIWHQAAQPGNTGNVVGDTWFDSDDGNKIYEWSGTAWVPNELGTNSLANLAITQAKIANAAVGTAQIGDAQITNAKIADATITNAKIADATIQSAKIAALDAGKITTGTLSAYRIGANSINAAKLVLASFENLIADPGFEYNTSAAWTLAGGATNGTTNPRTGSRALALPTAAAAYVGANQVVPFKVEPGDKFRVLYWVRMASGVSAGGTVSVRFKHGPSESGPWTDGANITAPAGVGTTYTMVEGEYTVPPSASWVRPEIVCWETPAGKTYYVDDVAMYKKASAELIVDGAITTRKLAAEAVEANNIKAGTITVNEVSPTFGSDLVLTANGAVTTIINAQADQASQIAAAQNTADDANTTAQQANAAAGVAQGQVDTLNGTVNTINTAQQATQSQVTNLQTWFRVDAQGAHVGQTGSVFQTHIRPDQFDITENDVVTTYWQAGQMVVPSLVADKMKLTNFQFEAYGSGMVVRLL